MVSNSRISSRAEIAVFSVNLVSRVFHIDTRRFSIKHPLVSIFLNVIQTCIHEKLNHWQRRKVAFFETLNGFSWEMIKTKRETADSYSKKVFELCIFCSEISTLLIFLLFCLTFVVKTLRDFVLIACMVTITIKCSTAQHFTYYFSSW
jgi:hypothetical protein